MRSTFAVTTALALLFGTGLANAADPIVLAETGGFLSEMLIVAASQPSVSSALEK